MNSIEIKILLYRKRKSIASIARELGVTDAAIHHVINGRRPSRRVRMAIAKAVGRRVEDLWPSKSFKKAA